MQGAQDERAGVSNDAGAAHPCRNRAMSGERKGQRRAPEREQLQRRSVAPREAGGKQDADRQPAGALAVQHESRVALQRHRRDRDRRDPQRQVQTGRAGGAQQRIADGSEGDGRNKQPGDRGRGQRIETGRRGEHVANDSVVCIAVARAVPIVSHTRELYNIKFSASKQRREISDHAARGRLALSLCRSQASSRRATLSSVVPGCTPASRSPVTPLESVEGCSSSAAR